MESISVKPVRIREKRVNLNPLLNPISSLRQWTALKAMDGDNGGGDIETASYNSYEVFPKGRYHDNPLLNPVADLHEWRALFAEDTKPLTTEQPLPLNSDPTCMEFDEEVAVDASLSCWLSSSETTPSK